MNIDQIAAEAAEKIRNGTNMRKDGRAEAIIKSAIEKATESLRRDLALAQQMVEIESKRANEAESRAAHASEPT